MPRYRILEKSFIGNRLVQPGDEIESDETPAPHWEPLDKPAKAASKSAAADDAARAEAARVEAEARAAREASMSLPAAPQQEIARAEAEAVAADVADRAAAAAQAAADAEEHKDDPLA